MNLIVLKGRLIADPEVKKVGANQTTVCEFCVAVDRRFEKDKTDFIRLGATRVSSSVNISARARKSLLLVNFTLTNMKKTVKTVI